MVFYFGKTAPRRVQPWSSYANVRKQTKNFTSSSTSSVRQEYQVCSELAWQTRTFILQECNDRQGITVGWVVSYLEYINF